MLLAFANTDVDDGALRGRRARSGADDDLIRCFVVRVSVGAGAKAAASNELAVHVGVRAELLNKVDFNRNGVLAFFNDF